MKILEIEFKLSKLEFHQSQHPVIWKWNIALNLLKTYKHLTSKEVQLETKCLGPAATWAWCCQEVIGNILHHQPQYHLLQAQGKLPTSQHNLVCQELKRSKVRKWNSLPQNLTFSCQIFQALSYNPLPDLPPPISHLKWSLDHLLFSDHFQHSYEVIRTLRAAGVTVSVYSLSTG